MLLAASQALHIRLERGEITDKRIEGVRKTYDQVFEKFAPLACDRQLEPDLRMTLELIREKHYAV